MVHVVSGAPSAEMNIHVTGRRVLATLVDSLVLGLVYALMWMLFGSSSAEGGQVSASLSGLPFLVYVVLMLAYYILMEGYLGKTVGKLLLGIRVVREDNGEVPGVKTAGIRTMLRIIDGLYLYLVAFITVLTSGKNQRLGDMAAHTLVVRN